MSAHRRVAGRHRDLGVHSYRNEAPIRCALYWDNQRGVERPLRSRAQRLRPQPLATGPVQAGPSSGSLRAVTA